MFIREKLAVAALVAAVSMVGQGRAQDPAQAPVQEKQSVAATAPQNADATVQQAPATAAAVADAAQAPAGAGDATAAQAQGQAAEAPAAVHHVQWSKKGKTPYTGPNEVIAQAPTPMLDEEGKQRLDPDGKPMFNPPVKQQRDKFGHPLFDADDKPVFQTAADLGFDDHGKKLHGKKEKPRKTVSVSIASGTLTVDGMIGKAALNYDIKDFHYVYLYAPWIGTVVVSNVPFPGSRPQVNAFEPHTLTVNVEEHTFQMYSDRVLLDKKKKETAYVLVDRQFRLPSKVPVMGYGTSLKAPYAWPGAKQNPVSKAYVQPPPVPVSLRPVQLLSPCPPGQMRDSSKVALPGEDGPPAPCVTIVAGKPTAVASAPSAGPAAAPAAETAAQATVPPSQK